MKELIEKIANYQKELAAGKLHATDLEPMLQCVRDLEEQLIVLRFKAFEAEYNMANENEVVEKPAVFESKITETDVEERIEPIAFDFGNVEELPAQKEDLTEDTNIDAQEDVVISPNQTSLIDAIAEMQENVSVNDRLANENADNTIGEKLRRMPIDDLKSAIGLNQKFWFISNLFNDDADAYNQFIERINRQESIDHAMKIVNDEIKEQFNWEEVEDKSVYKFLDYVERRFLQES